MRDLREKARELERGEKGEALRALAASAEARRVGALLDAQAVEKAVGTGDAEAMRKLLGTLLQTEEGRRLAENVRKMMQD